MLLSLSHEIQPLGRPGKTWSNLYATQTEYLPGDM